MNRDVVLRRSAVTSAVAYARRLVRGRCAECGFMGRWWAACVAGVVTLGAVEPGSRDPAGDRRHLGAPDVDGCSVIVDPLSRSHIRRPIRVRIVTLGTTVDH